MLAALARASNAREADDRTGALGRLRAAIMALGGGSERLPSWRRRK